MGNEFLHSEIVNFYWAKYQFFTKNSVNYNKVVPFLFIDGNLYSFQCFISHFEKNQSNEQIITDIKKLVQRTSTTK